ncbi:molecular chaperone GrpE [Desulfosarcina sp. BuS5]|uniref:nucleotide exchange factor GrpE n=1 Tax=Desulfosarcina sp. BuS5 TaxID=933262 RepID=UPI000553DD3A|nr:nucleotide exchange factor GrpE [Desulfosarcina sp. BuS5]WDN89055.1 molecular chaperone GrpE [Desulfosarcina sp. BuS5]
MTGEKEAKKDTESLKAGKENKKKLKSVSSKADKKKDTPNDLLDQLKSEKEAAEQEAKDTYDKLLRISAEFDNYKKRTARDMDEFRKFANESLLMKLLPVVDNLERAISSSQEKKSSESCITEGINMTLQEILNIFETFQVKPIESLNKTFDPNFHQAVMQEETEEIEENIIIKEFQKGYMIQNRLLRPAMVVVAKAKTNKSDNS